MSQLYPNALLSHRSAFEYAPSQDGRIILTFNTNRQVKYPGLTLEFVRGPAPLEDDLKFFNFHASSPSRALLENLNVTARTVHRTTF